MHCLRLHGDLPVDRLPLRYVSRPSYGRCLGPLHLEPPIAAAATAGCAGDEGGDRLFIQPLREEVEQMATDPEPGRGRQGWRGGRTWAWPRFHLFAGREGGMWGDERRARKRLRPYAHPLAHLLTHLLCIEPLPSAASQLRHQAVDGAGKREPKGRLSRTHAHFTPHVLTDALTH